MKREPELDVRVGGRAVHVVELRVRQRRRRRRRDATLGVGVGGGRVFRFGFGFGFGFVALFLVGEPSQRAHERLLRARRGVVGVGVRVAVRVVLGAAEPRRRGVALRTRRLAARANRRLTVVFNLFFRDTNKGEASEIQGRRRAHPRVVQMSPGSVVARFPRDFLVNHPSRLGAVQRQRGVNLAAQHLARLDGVARRVSLLLFSPAPPRVSVPLGELGVRPRTRARRVQAARRLGRDVSFRSRRARTSRRGVRFIFFFRRRVAVFVFVGVF